MTFTNVGGNPSFEGVPDKILGSGNILLVLEGRGRKRVNHTRRAFRLSTRRIFFRKARCSFLKLDLLILLLQTVDVHILGIVAMDDGPLASLIGTEVIVWSEQPIKPVQHPLVRRRVHVTDHSSPKVPRHGFQHVPMPGDGKAPGREPLLLFGATG